MITQTLTCRAAPTVSVIADLERRHPGRSPPFVNDVSAVAEGSTRVTVRHAADAPAVERAGQRHRRHPDLAPGAQASAVLPAGTYDIQVQLTDGTPLPALSPGTRDPPGWRKNG